MNVFGRSLRISSRRSSVAKARRDQDLREDDLDPVDLSLPPGDIKRCLHRYTIDMLPIGPRGPAGAGRYGSVIEGRLLDSSAFDSQGRIRTRHLSLPAPMLQCDLTATNDISYKRLAYTTLKPDMGE